MAITVGFIRAIGVITDEVFTPDIYATLEEKFVLKGQLEEAFPIIAKLEEVFSMRGILEKGLTFIAWLEEKFTMKGKAKK